MSKPKKTAKIASVKAGQPVALSNPRSCAACGDTITLVKDLHTAVVVATKITGKGAVSMTSHKETRCSKCK